MTTFTFIIALILIGIIGVCAYINCKSKKYPPYYHDVYITFKFPNETVLHKKRAWLSVNDNEELTWTCVDSNIIIQDEWVTSWEEI